MMALLWAGRLCRRSWWWNSSNVSGHFRLRRWQEAQKRALGCAARWQKRAGQFPSVVIFFLGIVHPPVLQRALEIQRMAVEREAGAKRVREVVLSGRYFAGCLALLLA